MILLSQPRIFLLQRLLGRSSISIIFSSSINRGLWWTWNCWLHLEGYTQDFQCFWICGFLVFSFPLFSRLNKSFPSLGELHQLCRWRLESEAPLTEGRLLFGFLSLMVEQELGWTGPKMTKEHGGGRHRKWEVMSKCVSYIVLKIFTRHPMINTLL